MTTPPQPPLAPDERVATGNEREVLETFLDMYRDVVARKLAGIDESQARQRRVPSQTTLAGLVKHLTSVEREWFQAVLAQRGTADSGLHPNGGWQIGDTETVADLLADYRAACADSRAVTADLGLDDTVPAARLGRVSLRWVLVHMIEETARHSGHLDILREQTDGATGFDG